MEDMVEARVREQPRSDARHHPDCPTSGGVE
jgi:hypothetical protein